MNYQILTAAQLSAHLRSLRKAQNLSQSELGARIGMPQSRFGKIERNPAQVSVGELLKILAALGVRVVLQTPSKGPGTLPKPNGDNGNW